MRYWSLSDKHDAVRWLVLVGIGVGLLMALGAVLVIVARRLPPGLARDLVEFLPACVTTARRLRGDARVPRRVKVALLLAVLWLLSPIDLVPEFLPVVGPLDDIVVALVALRYAARHTPRDALWEAWPAERRLLERVLGSSQPH